MGFEVVYGIGAVVLLRRSCGARTTTGAGARASGRWATRPRNDSTAIRKRKAVQQIVRVNAAVRGTAAIVHIGLNVHLVSGGAPPPGDVIG
jgi:hypothetical protein